jgi:hypothetical protein
VAKRYKRADALGLDEAAARLGISKRDLERKVEAGELGAFPDGARSASDSILVRSGPGSKAGGHQVPPHPAPRGSPGMPLDRPLSRAGIPGSKYARPRAQIWRRIGHWTHGPLPPW